jgi:hypothetical protein
MARLPPPEIAAHAEAVQAWLDSEEAAEREAANRGPSAAERFNAIRVAQAQAEREGRRTLPEPPAPAPMVATTDPAQMTAGERWSHMRAHDQSKMPPWKDPRA